MLSCFSCVWLFATLWTIARQAPLSMRFSSQNYWSGLACLPLRDLSNPGIKPVFSSVQSLSHVWLIVTPWPMARQASLSTRVYPNSCPLSWWCHPTISSSVVLFSSCLQSFLASGSFQWVSSSYQVAKVLEFQLQHQFFQLIFKTDVLEGGLVGSPCSPRDSQESSPTPQFKSISSSVLSFLYSPVLIFIHDYWKNQSLDYTDLCWWSNVSAF